MTRFAIALATWSLLAVARAADLFFTFLFSPSLDEEANPIVSVLGGGVLALLVWFVFWFGILTTGIVVFLRGRSAHFDHRCDSFAQFVTAWCRTVVFDRQPLKSDFLGGSHSDQGLQALRLFGLALPWAIIFGSFAAVYAWLVVHGPLQTQIFLFTIISIGGYTCVPIAAAFIGFLLGAFLFWYSEYTSRVQKKYL